jgi:hypothetical protein
MKPEKQSVHDLTVRADKPVVGAFDEETSVCIISHNERRLTFLEMATASENKRGEVTVTRPPSLGCLQVRA